ncbi:MAG: lipid II:glycine glycyltransferase FemX [Patescibacteria group bacterium]
MKNIPEQHFLQSDFWFNILSSEGEIVLNFARLTTVKALEKKLPFGGKYLYFPRGPIFPENEPEKKEILAEIFEKKISSNLVFVRVEPNFADFNFLNEFCRIKGIQAEKSINLQPQKTLVLDLKKDLVVLEKELSQKTRYNIRLAEKKGVKIVKGIKDQFSEFWRLMKLTGERDNFGIHTKGHYEKLISLGGDNLELWLAEFEGQVIAAGIFCFFGSQSVYLHGASDNKFRNLMAPHLLQWTIIKEAKKRGCLFYDFYGIDEEKWPGVTRFKKGFGGEVLEYPGTYDLVLKPNFYYLYQGMRFVLRKLRKFL